jgi:hypothetical protein
MNQIIKQFKESQLAPIGQQPYSKLSVLKLQIAPPRICFLKFILEGYDGLAIISTGDAKQGLIEIRYPDCLQSELFQLLDNLLPSLLQESKLDGVANSLNLTTKTQR